MTSSSSEDAYNYAKFLVELFPYTAIDALCDPKICNLAEVEGLVDRACTKLGKNHTVKGLIQERKFDDLRILAAQHYGRQTATSPAVTPIARGSMAYTPGRPALPETPTSMASGSQAPPHNPGFQRIEVLYEDGMQPLIARGSGTDASFIGEDTLLRFPKVTATWGAPESVLLGGRLIEVGKWVHLTWSLPREARTQYTQFWVVRPDHIRDADVLLASTGPSSLHDNVAYSPLILDASRKPPPAAPTPPPAFQSFPSSSGIRSIHSSPAMSSTHSGYPPPRNAPASRQPSIMPSSPTPSRPRSAQPAKASQATSHNAVLVNLAFQGGRKKMLKLDLNSTSEDVLSKLRAQIQRANGGLPVDLSAHELTVSTLQKENCDSQDCQLDEEDFDAYWSVIVDFICDNRSPEPNKIEFLFDIG